MTLSKSLFSCCISANQRSISFRWLCYPHCSSQKLVGGGWVGTALGAARILKATLLSQMEQWHCLCNILTFITFCHVSKIKPLCLGIWHIIIQLSLQDLPTTLANLGDIVWLNTKAAGRVQYEVWFLKFLLSCLVIQNRVYVYKHEFVKQCKCISN